MPRKSLFFALSTLLSAPALLADQPDRTPSLQEAYQGKFLIGGTFNRWILAEPNHPAFALAATQFNSLSPANSMKWGPMNPQPGEYNFETADHFVDYGASHDMELVGHVLFWHSQTPDWVYEDAEGNLLTREALLDRMRERARLMAERYGDRVKLWDVVNESIEGDGSWRKSKFQQIIGDDFTEQAFRIAMEELPEDAILIYNDYGMTDPGRRDAVVAMVRDFQKKGIRIDGIGMQGHWSMHRPTLPQIEASILSFASTGVSIHITELDVDFLGRDEAFGANVDIRTLAATQENNPFPDGKLPASEEERLAERYGELFELLVKHSDKIDRVTFWGVADSDSWLNNWPIRGRTNYPLLFDRDFQPKPAFYEVIKAAGN